MLASEPGRVRLAALRIFDFLSERPAVAVCAGLVLVAAIAAADYATGYEIRLAVLYLIPIGIVTWQAGWQRGSAIAVLASLTWFLSFERSNPYSRTLFFYWEGGVLLLTFLIFVLLLFRLRSALERSEERLMVVLEGLEAAVRVDGVLSGALLYMNGRCRALFSDQTPSPADRGEVFHAPTQRWYLVQSQPLRWVDGRAALLRIFSDVTEIRRAREVVDKHKEAAHRSARLVALGEFASAIAHELSQPLAAISTYNTTALRLLPSEPGESELRIAIQKCSDQAQRAGAIIQRLREILRQPVAPRVREDLNEVARAGLELAQGEAEELGVDVKFQPCAQPLKVRVDRLLVEQVVVNLLRNAVEAVSESRMGAPREVVLVTDSTSPGHALLSVEDTGDGVSPDVQRQLFEPFVTTKPSGLGLGLSICRSVVEAQEGTIHYEPLPRGSRFVVTLPAYA